MRFQIGKDVLNCGDIEFKDTNPAKAFEVIRSTISKNLEDGSKILSLGGDHSVTYPILKAFSEKYDRINILHLDAHADLYEDFEDNPFSHASPFARIMETGKIQSLTQVGIRTFNTHQRQQAKKYDVHIIEMKDFNFGFLKNLQGPLYVSLDLDVLDPAFAPGVSHHEPGGISTRTLIDIIQNIPVEIIGADIVEYNPVRDTNNMTAMVGYKMMKELLAKMI